METSHLVRFKTIVTSVIGVIKAKELSICIRCVARYCNIMKVFNSKPETLEHDLVLLFPDDEQAKQLLTESRFCSSCLNSLTDEFVKAQADELIGKIEAEKDVTTFQLHISLPAIMTLRNEYFARLFGTEKDYISQKELFRVLLSNQLVSRLNVTYNPQSNLVIEMHFKHPDSDKECQQLVDSMPQIFYEKKCRKSMASSFINHSSILRSLENLDNEALKDLQLLQTNVGCTLEEIKIRNEPIYIAGRYLKFSRTVCQTPWLVEGESIFKTSVQDIIQTEVAKFIQFKTFKFSASGREDVDVRMLGRGRPFLLEITNPRFAEEEDILNKIKANINQNKDVNVLDFQFVDKQISQLLLKGGAEEKSKTYQALCCLDRKVTEEDFEILNKIKDLKIVQPTPIRVLHRRTVADRTRTIYSMWTEKVSTEDLEPKHQPYVDQIFKLNLTCEAGTYVKELCHSDFGRTKPSLSTLLPNCLADLISLDVSEVNLDWPKRID